MAKDNILLLLHKTKRTEKRSGKEIQDNPATVLTRGKGQQWNNAHEADLRSRQSSDDPERGTGQTKKEQ